MVLISAVIVMFIGWFEVDLLVSNGSFLCFHQEFFKAHPAPAAERTIRQSLENIQLNMNQLNKERDAIKAFLS